MTTNQMRIYFEDECPKIGCGWRTVNVKIGRKWVYFIDPYNGNKCRIKKAKAEILIASRNEDYVSLCEKDENWRDEIEA